MNLSRGGWYAYYRVGNSNRIFLQIDWAVQSELRYGSDVNTSAVGGRLGRTGTISSCTNGVACIES